MTDEHTLQFAQEVLDNLPEETRAKLPAEALGELAEDLQDTIDNFLEGLGEAV